MHDRYLHEGETLLVSRHSSPAVLLMSILRGLLEGVVTGAVVILLLSGALYFIRGNGFLANWIYVSLIIVSAVAIVYQRIRIWREAMFRVTTERILLSDPTAFFHAPLTTIKWPQYQECEVGHKKFFDFFFGARPLWFRYGTADARYEIYFPSLRYAEDLKHYLDKVDSAVRKNDIAGLRPFVAKPRGKRDEPVA